MRGRCGTGVNSTKLRGFITARQTLGHVATQIPDLSINIRKLVSQVKESSSCSSGLPLFNQKELIDYWQELLQPELLLALTTEIVPPV